MAQALNKTKRRITSVKNTKKLTEAMELVATVKLRKFKNILDKNQFYVNEINNIISNLFAHLNVDEEVPYIKSGKGKKDLVLVINSNFGLCAGYNANVINFVKRNVSKENSIIMQIGFKGEAYLQKDGYEVISDFIGVNDKLNYDEILKIGRSIISDFLSGKYHDIKVVYTKYVNSIRFEPAMLNLLPLSLEGTVGKYGIEPIYDPNDKTLIEELVPIAVVSSLYSKLIESQVSEQASRRNAMDSANDNAQEIIDKLTNEFNKARQAAITQEIIEVVSGKQS